MILNIIMYTNAESHTATEVFSVLSEQQQSVFVHRNILFDQFSVSILNGLLLLEVYVCISKL